MGAVDHEPDHVLEDLTFLAENGIGASEAAHRVGMNSAKSLDKWLRRHDQAALANQLHRQEPLALVASRKDR